MALTVAFSELASLVGQQLGPTAWMAIDQPRIDLFADATEDHQWLHVDPQAAAKGPFGATIAHGYLTLSLVNKFMPELISVTNTSMGVNYGCEKVRFPSPVKVGANIRAVGEIVSVSAIGSGVSGVSGVSGEQKPQAQQLVIRVTVEIEGADRPACVVDTVSRFYP